ncbi:hypothetical protein KCP78_11190 [Salmonella enterica subsp. enterica]|nr:hypothetical protein KCP78_11190 [Salmonella enterica subsp. enterica]
MLIAEGLLRRPVARRQRFAFSAACDGWLNIRVLRHHQTEVSGVKLVGEARFPAGAFQ